MTEISLDNFRIGVGKVIIERTDKKAVSDGGIAIPEMAKKWENTGVVVKAAKFYRTKKGANVPIDLKVGDFIYFKRAEGSPLKLGDKMYHCLDYTEIYGVKDEG